MTSGLPAIRQNRCKRLSLMMSRHFIGSLLRSTIRLLACRMLEFAFGLQPIIKFLAWQGATFQMDFMCSEPDFFVTRPVVCGNNFRVRLNLPRAKLQGFMPLISLAFALQCHV